MTTDATTDAAVGRILISVVIGHNIDGDAGAEHIKAAIRAELEAAIQAGREYQRNIEALAASNEGWQ